MSDDELYGLATGDRDLVVLPGGMTLSTHGPNICAGDSCCIHAPSDHPMKEAPQVWIREMQMMFRVCSCKAIHPDPDSLRYHNLFTNGPFYNGYHPCCARRCCINGDQAATVE